MPSAALSGASSSTSAKLTFVVLSAPSTPPALAGSSNRDRTAGRTARQLAHHDAVQNVIRGRREEVATRSRSSSSEGVRTLQEPGPATSAEEE